MENLDKKFPRITIHKITNGFIVGIHPENKDLQKLMTGYVKEFISQIQNADGEDWKQKIQDQIDKTLKISGNDGMRVFVCSDAIEVLALIAPSKEVKPGELNLDWFWSEEGHLPD